MGVKSEAPNTPPHASAGSEGAQGDRKGRLGGENRPNRHILEFLAFTGFFAGALLITYSYSLATVDSSTSPYDIFWAGMIIGITPAAMLALSHDSSRGTRAILLMGIASLTFLPKFLMSIHGPIYFDENAHFRELQETIRSGHLFQPNTLVPISQHFPGLEAVSAAIHSLSGLDPWQCALLTILLAHCLTPLSVYLLAERLKIGHFAATLAALLYMANPSYMYFDTQYAYESLALAFVVVTLVCQVALFRSAHKREAFGFAILGIITGAATVVTHHLSAIALVGFMFVFMVCLWQQYPKSERRGMASLSTQMQLVRRYALLQFVTIVAIFGTWFGLEAPSTWQYLSPFFTGGVKQVLATVGITGAGSSNVRRTLLSGSTLPNYEILFIRLTPFVAALLCGVAGIYWLKHRRVPRMWFVVFVLALLYFLSLPLDLTVTGSAGAHRSWAFSFICLAMAMAIGMDVICQSVIQKGAGYKRFGWFFIWATTLSMFAGNMSANANADVRFITPHVWGSDSREVTSETAQLADWFNTEFPNGVGITVDRYTGAYLFSRTTVREIKFYSSPLVTYFYYRNTPIPLNVWGDTVRGGYFYIVVDKRLSSNLGLLTSPFLGSERDLLPEPGALTRFQNYPWTPLVYESTNYAVYRIDAAAIPPDANG
jgi:hypothetical protein